MYVVALRERGPWLCDVAFVATQLTISLEGQAAGSPLCSGCDCDPSSFEPCWLRSELAVAFSVAYAEVREKV